MTTFRNFGVFEDIKTRGNVTCMERDPEPGAMLAPTHVFSVKTRARNFQLRTEAVFVIQFDACCTVCYYGLHPPSIVTYFVILCFTRTRATHYVWYLTLYAFGNYQIKKLRNVPNIHGPWTSICVSKCMYVSQFLICSMLRTSKAMSRCCLF